MPKTLLIKALAIGLAALLVNLPLGRLRAASRKYSPAWFVYVHLSVPLIVWLRVANRVSLWAIPAFIACAVCGQLAGGRLFPGASRGAV